MPATHPEKTETGPTKDWKSSKKKNLFVIFHM